jgi:non-ribosomal peptide synthetase component F
VLQFASLSFDASVFEIAMALFSGGHLILPAAEKVLAGEELAGLLERDRVTHLTIPPSVLESVAERSYPALQTVIVAGEACGAKLAAKWGKERRFFNAYGPTEATVWVTIERCGRDEVRPAIGRPIENTRVFVLDRNGEPVAVGMAGELHVGGAGVARGYAGRGDLTAERFLPDPWGGGERLYRTGDLVRLRAAGGLEFIGRTDEQVKIRGFRIEPGEIQAALQAQPSILHAIVVIREEASSQRFMEAYIVTEDAQADVEAIRARLARRIPAYMMPSAIYLLDVLPLTPNGKVDRSSLHPPKAFQHESPAKPGTPVEAIIEGLWCELLNRDRVGVHENFFEIGGQSLLATQLISRLRLTFNLEVDFRVFFDNPTIRELALHIQSFLFDEGTTFVGQTIPRLGKERALASYAQQRLWFLEQVTPTIGVYNVPSGVRLQGWLSVGALRKSLERVVERHEILRTRFVVEQELMQVIERSVEVRLGVVDLSGLERESRERELKRLWEREAERGFELERRAPWRAGLIRLEPSEHVLVLTLHHIMADGWSMGVLIRELTESYAALKAGREWKGKELTIQYADYAEWQREWLRGERLERQVEYWREQLKDLPVLELATDRERPEKRSYRGGQEKIELGRELSAKIRELSRRQGVTEFMLLLAAYQVLLSRYAGQLEVVTGTPIAGRNHPQSEDLIGFFVNTLVLRGDLGGDPPFEKYLERVRETALRAYANQDVPFERLVEELRPVRETNRHPLFQVTFALQNTPAAVFHLPELIVEGLDLSSRVAKFDLALTFIEPAKEEGSYEALLDYAADLFSKPFACAILQRLVALLHNIVANPEQRISELSLLAPHEQSGNYVLRSQGEFGDREWERFALEIDGITE